MYVLRTVTGVDWNEHALDQYSFLEQQQASTGGRVTYYNHLVPVLPVDLPVATHVARSRSRV